MLPTTSGGSSFTVAVPNEAALHRIVVDIAMALTPGDLVTLSGDLGAGKTTFARALIRYLAGDNSIEVPSPSFNIVQEYDLPRFPLVHVDLYRLSGSSGELAELGFDDLSDEEVVLLEWPDRAAGYLPPDRFDIALTLVPQLGLEFRNVRVTGYGVMAPRVERIRAIRDFLDDSGFAAAQRRHVQGDASTRSYERLVLNGHSYVLMNAPRRPDGPPVRGGKPYSAIAHLAEDVTPFVAMTRALRARGLSAPDVLHADMAQGLLLIEDLGDDRFVAGDPPAPIEDRYAAAVDLLADLHRQDLPPVLPVAPHVEHRIPSYDIEAFLIEVDLLVDWYLLHMQAAIPYSVHKRFVGLWRDALQPAIEAKPTWVLRDFHSPNLLWLAERNGIARVGLLDFQDALMGPGAYDLASLLQDARVDVPESMELALIGRYVRARRAADPQLDVPLFARLYATMAAQRATKILGIFARLHRRDGKPQYLRHMPRIWAYLRRALAHPALAPLDTWYGAHVPEPTMKDGT
jgi:tRNA threonylcarbamoyl adenosine modification protein YjeE